MESRPKRGKTTLGWCLGGPGGPRAHSRHLTYTRTRWILPLLTPHSHVFYRINLCRLTDKTPFGPTRAAGKKLQIKQGERDSGALSPHARTQTKCNAKLLKLSSKSRRLKFLPSPHTKATFATIFMQNAAQPVICPRFCIRYRAGRRFGANCIRGSSKFSARRVSDCDCNPSQIAAFSHVVILFYCDRRFYSWWDKIVREFMNFLCFIDSRRRREHARSIWALREANHGWKSKALCLCGVVLNCFFSFPFQFSGSRFIENLTSSYLLRFLTNEATKTHYMAFKLALWSFFTEIYKKIDSMSQVRSLLPSQIIFTYF